MWRGKSKVLTNSQQASVVRVVDLLIEHGPGLPFPHSSGIESSKHRHMRELRIQHRGRAYRVLYAFDPRRAAILLLGGDKTEPPCGMRRVFRKLLGCMTSTC